MARNAVVRPIRVLFFAGAREATGTTSVTWPTPQDGVTVGALLDALVARYPRLGPIVAKSRFVVNAEYADGRSTRIRPGDEFAIHPPYSGG